MLRFLLFSIGLFSMGSVARASTLTHVTQVTAVDAGDNNLQIHGYFSNDPHTGGKIGQDTILTFKAFIFENSQASVLRSDCLKFALLALNDSTFSLFIVTKEKDVKTVTSCQIKRDFAREIKPTEEQIRGSSAGWTIETEKTSTE